MTWTTPRPPAPRTARRTALRAGASVAVLASAALLLTACSSSSSPKASNSVAPSASGSSGTNGKNAQAMDAYRNCLSQHGVKLPSFSPGARPSGRPSDRPSGTGRRGGGFGGGFGGASADPATQKAIQACASLRPQFNGQRGGGNSTAFKAFTSCLKDHGVVLPSASASPGSRNGGGFGALRGINTSDPKTAKAYDTCKALLPQRPSGRPSSSASPSAS